MSTTIPMALGVYNELEIHVNGQSGSQVVLE